MAVAQDKQDVDANDNDNLPKQAPATEQKAAADSDNATEEAESTDSQGDAAQKVSPSLTVTNPGSGAQYPAGESFPVEFDCAGGADFTAHVSVVDAAGQEVLGKHHQVELVDGKGHGELKLGGDKMAAGKYDVLVWGESGGQTSAVQKIQVEVVDTEAEEAPAPTLAVEGDDGDNDNAAVT